MSELILPNDPVEIAKPFAVDLMISGYLDDFDGSDEVLRAITELDYVATESGLIDKKYFVQSQSSLVLPIDLDHPNIEGIRFPELLFEGNFRSYSSVYVGRMVGRGSMRALCLTFDNVTLLPFMDSIDDNHLLHVPVFAVSDINKILA